MISLLTNFNPRSHEGSDAMSAEKVFNADISIHAPTRGATYISKKVGYGIAISIHAPTRGATYRLARHLRYTGNFNPRSHEGSDRARKTVF